MDNLDLYDQLINWHRAKHKTYIDNSPNQSSEAYLKQLSETILLPIYLHFGILRITYGFTNSALTRYIQTNHRSGTAPHIDQHSCQEMNSKGIAISNRNGAACDFVVDGYKDQMHEIAEFICRNLPFDKLYFYGRTRPIHVSVSDNPLRHLQLMQQSDSGRRYLGKRAFGDQAIMLSQEL
jgi:hypothetical protein